MALTATPYERAVAAIDAVSWRGIRPGLERTEALLGALGSPQDQLSGALVAGTNGKGSVCALVDSVLRAAGIRSVLLTKPHLISYCERLVAGGAEVTKDEFAALIDDVTRAATALPPELQPTGFEMLTAAGVLFAARQRADAVVCEVGMGGRLDSTNVLDLGVAAITNVELDHMEHLGPTVEAIAREKAAIVKSGDTAVTAASGAALDIIRERCDGVGASLTVVDPTAVDGGVSQGLAGVSLDAEFAGERISVDAPLVGRFQLANLATGIAVCEALRRRGASIEASAVQRGCAAVRWPGRMQWIAASPPVLLDAAHNPAGMTALAATVRDVAGARPVIAVFAAMRDKDAGGMADALQRAGPAAIITTSPDVQRATPADELALHFTPPARAIAKVRNALDVARELAGDRGVVLVCGSLYLVGEAMQLLGAMPGG